MSATAPDLPYTQERLKFLGLVGIAVRNTLSGINWYRIIGVTINQIHIRMLYFCAKTATTIYILLHRLKFVLSALGPAQLSCQQPGVVGVRKTMPTQSCEGSSKLWLSFCLRHALGADRLCARST